MRLPARIVVAGTASGVGKTTVAIGLIGALRAAGRRVQGFKVGPDYIDPGYHALASGRPGRNLDAFLSGAELIAPLARHGAQSADIAVIEGVMGLFDGASGRGELASTAHVAKLLQAPVVLVVDARSMARSAAALVHGYRSFDPELELAGVVLNRIGSDHHEQLLREALDVVGVPVLGALRRDERLLAPERHLGLIPVGEREAGARAALDALAAAVARSVDLAAVERIARTAPGLDGPAWRPESGMVDQRAVGGTHSAPHADERSGAGPQIAIAGGPAFCFHYRENLELLEAAGAQLLLFDPLTDPLPEGTDALLLGGGFPEVHCGELAENAAVRAQIAALAAAGRPVLAECGGMLYLARELDGHAMCGVVPARARMTDSLTLGYREATAVNATPWHGPGEQVRGHEFHYSALDADDEAGDAAWLLRARGKERTEGYVSGSVQASYLHVHWAAFPRVARGFARAAATHAPAGASR